MGPTEAVERFDRGQPKEQHEWAANGGVHWIIGRLREGLIDGFGVEVAEFRH